MVLHAFLFLARPKYTSKCSPALLDRDPQRLLPDGFLSSSGQRQVSMGMAIKVALVFAQKGVNLL